MLPVDCVVFIVAEPLPAVEAGPVVEAGDSMVLTEVGDNEWVTVTITGKIPVICVTLVFLAIAHMPGTLGVLSLTVIGHTKV